MDKPFLCHFCPYKGATLRHNLHHRIHHRHINKHFICGFHGCKAGYLSEASLRAHVIRSHNHVKLRNSSNCHRSIAASNSSGTFTCTVPYCQKIVDDYRTLIKHLNTHMEHGTTVTCPIAGCASKYDKKNSLSAHLSKAHRQKKQSSDHDMQPQALCVQEDSNYSVIEENCEEEKDFVFEETDCDLALDALAQFFMRLQFKLQLPASTVQYIASELCVLEQQDHSFIKTRLRKKLQVEGVPEDKVEDIAAFIFENNPISSARAELNTIHLRQETYKSRYTYVPPQKTTKKKGNKSVTFYYIPLKETLAAAFKDKSLDLNISKPHYSEEGLLEDFVDGSVFKNNPYFQENQEAIPLLLYQDAFEVVVPIGPAKRKYKVQAVYMSYGNAPDHVRSTSSIQLVALCLDSTFDHDIVYGSIVQDLKDIEENGVFVSGHGIVKAGLVFVVGDNLGSHGVGGFVESFSNSRFFCRFCYIHRDTFHSPGGECVNNSPRRTVESYNCDLQSLARSKKKIYHGVKRDSVFNSLSSFHVCLPGLVPCLAHDLFEGLAAHDLKLYIDHFVEQKWFAYKDLEKAMLRFPYSVIDKRDKPISVKEDHSRVKGGAWQVCIFLKLFPLIMKDFIGDVEDQVWQAMLLLIEIVEIVISPVIHKSYLAYLQSIIDSYLAMRKEQFGLVPLRPKHHYLSHYPELFEACGPLIRVMTLRYESKHCFFKKTLREAKKFINPLKTLAVKHEMFQSYVRTGAEARFRVKTFHENNFNSVMYSESLQQAIPRALSDSTIRECARASVNGTTYNKGDVIIRQSGYQYNVEMGRICLLLICHDKISFLLEKLKTEFVPYLRAYEVSSSLPSVYEWMELDTLLSSQSLSSYCLGPRLYVKLKFGLVSDIFSVGQ